MVPTKTEENAAAALDLLERASADTDKAHGVLERRLSELATENGELRVKLEAETRRRETEVADLKRAHKDELADLRRANDAREEKLRKVQAELNAPLVNK